MSMPPPRRKPPTQYKKPRRLNAVSLSMLLFMTLAVYFVYCTWPLIALRLRVKGELEDVMNEFWRINLRSPGGQGDNPELNGLRKNLLARLSSAGVRDPHPEVVFERGKKRIAIEARFHSSAYFPGLDKTYIFELAPRAETHAARVDW
jgi:hypothetical protein